jgi:muramoyltetrapeptide carboxypeptidase
VLQPGDLVRLVSPASYPDDAGVLYATAILAGWGLRVDVADHTLDQWGYMAGHDDDRLADLHAAYRDPEVRALIATRGGAGAYRLLDGLDADLVRADPKPLVGFSDITYLHLSLWARCGVPGIHGGLGGPRATASVRHLLMTGEPMAVHRDDATYGAELSTGSSVSGVLMGGNLTALATMVGAGLPSLDGAILLVEHERPAGLGLAIVDRQVTQLLRSGALRGVRGVALGRFPGYDGYSDRGWTLYDVLADRLGALGVPVLGGLELGHGHDPLAVPLGVPAHLDPRAGVLTVSPHGNGG